MIPFSELIDHPDACFCVSCGQIDEEDFHDQATCPGAGGVATTCPHGGVFDCWVADHRAQGCDDCRRIIWDRRWGGTPVVTDWEWFAGSEEDVNTDHVYAIGGVATRDRAIEEARSDYPAGTRIVLIEARSSATEGDDDGIVPFIFTRNREEMTL